MLLCCKDDLAAPQSPIRCSAKSRFTSQRHVGKRLDLLVGEKRIEETDIHHATTECFPGAMYFLQGRSHVVERLDLERGKISLIPRDAGHYTELQVATDVDILCTEQQTRREAAHVYVGDILVTRTITSHVRQHSVYHSVLDRFDLDSPLSTQLETKALWILVDDAAIEELKARGFDPAGSLHAAEHSLIALLPLHVLGDRRDIGGVSVVPFHAQTGRATIFSTMAIPAVWAMQKRHTANFHILLRQRWKR